MVAILLAEVYSDGFQLVFVVLLWILTRLLYDSLVEVSLASEYGLVGNRDGGRLDGISPTLA